jgi:hypothetical protein
MSGNAFAGSAERCAMSEKKRQKKAGQDKNKKNQARRRRGPSKNTPASGRQREIAT